ncbi:MAG TPA: hypothetical protein VMV27_01725 [Candidatus Binataceae bacterium]|nr:hypothetical protein [Candidatus Binataceae bacterium]
MPNPVEILGRARNRIARVAAIRAGAYALAPAIVAVILALGLTPIGQATWMRWGYILAPERAAMLREILLAIAAGALAAGGIFAIRAHRRALDFVAAAQRVDDAMRAHEEILTFAALADPDLAESQKTARSPLFPLLWRHAIGLLERFDPIKTFPLAIGRPLARSSMIAGALAAVMIIAAMGLVRPPTREQAIANRLREIAREIEATSNDPTDRAIAGEARAAADALENRSLPPLQKEKKLKQAMRDIKQQKKQSESGNKKGAGAGAGSQATKGNGKGQSQGSDKGTGTGPGGKDKSSQPGSGSGKSQQGKNSGSNNQQGKQGKQSKDSSAELQKELAKAQAQVETDAKNSPKPDAKKPGDDTKPGNAPKSGGNPDKSGTTPNPDSARPGSVPTASANVHKNVPPTGGAQAGAKDFGSNQGDTHLGETPAAANYQRYLKPGEKGAALDIHDARYVMFRLPNAAVIGAGGKTVIDSNRPTASTAYVNAPLKETTDQSAPDERQLVPPRYRDLIH